MLPGPLHYGSFDGARLVRRAGAPLRAALALAAAVPAQAGPVLEVRAIGDGAADLVVFAGGAGAGWRAGMRAEVRKEGVPPASLLVVAVGERCAAAVIEDVPEGSVLEAGDEVSPRVVSQPR